ncbi:MAG TPA: hypothetical protein VHY76_14880, partial [Acetobacteraceae bacterium]|nr:hypothetical protein [Acetobacteraceae bacterium]
MANVTVAGGKGIVWTLPYGATANAALASTLASAITTLVNDGRMTTFINSGQSGDTVPPAAAGTTGELIQTVSGLVSLPAAYKAVVVTAPSATIFGGGAAGESILSGSGNLSFFSSGGSGTVAAGGGNNLVMIQDFGTGNWNISTGAGNDTIDAGSGNDQIAAGGGSNSILLGSGSDTVISTGNDSIQATTGNATISASGSASDFISGGIGHLTFINSSPNASTILGGQGSISVFGGPGGGL